MSAPTSIAKKPLVKNASSGPAAEEEPILSAERRASDIARPPRVGVNGILMGALGAMILILMSFLSLPMPNVLAGLYVPPTTALSINYNFQLPFAVFLGAFLGPTLGAGAVLGFILVGLLVLPVFAGGGGDLTYLLQPGFGFIVGMYIAAWMTGRMIRRVLKASSPKRVATLFAVAFTAVLVTYATGAVYGVGLVLAHQLSWMALQNTLFHLAGELAVYDILATVMWLSLVRYARLLFWLILY